jgi:stage II sporulation protein M
MVKKRKETWLRKGFFESLEYIKESKEYINSIIVLFFASSFVGFFFASQFGFIDELLEGIVSQIIGLGMWDIIVFIFANNASSSFFGLLLGGFFGIFSIIVTVVNGLVLGYVFESVYQVSGIRDWWRILPHGIFELPAIFISLGLGLRLGFSFFEGKKWKKEFYRRFVEGMKAFLLVVIPLLVVAAFIEGILIGLRI